MAAPAKKGLDYFPFDVDLLNDVKLRRPKMKYGHLATMIYISLLCMLYKDKGYYIDYRNKDDVIWQVLNDLQGKHQPTQDTVADVIDDLVACELFSGDLYQAGIITSLRSQTTYYKATVDRKTVDIIDEYWLLDLEKMQGLSAKHCYCQKCLNRTNNGVNRAINGVNRAINKQSKVKESKVKESKVNYYVADGDKNNNHDILTAYSEALNRSLTTIEATALEGLIAQYGDKNTLKAVQEAIKRGKVALAYIGKILENGEKKPRSGRKYRDDQNENHQYEEIFEVE